MFSQGLVYFRTKKKTHFVLEASAAEPVLSECRNARKKKLPGLPASFPREHKFRQKENGLNMLPENMFLCQLSCEDHAGAH